MRWPWLERVSLTRTIMFKFSRFSHSNHVMVVTTGYRTRLVHPERSGNAIALASSPARAKRKNARLNNLMRRVRETTEPRDHNFFNRVHTPTSGIANITSSQPSESTHGSGSLDRRGLFRDRAASRSPMRADTSRTTQSV